MDSGFARVEQLFHRALELPPSQRQSFLLEATAGSPEILRQVEELLAASEQDDQLQAPQEAPSPTPNSDWRQGQIFGHYRILRLLGRGGMGAVYLAERSDGEFDQQVALKLLAPNLVEDSFAERFRGERQVLAHLNHPNIVHLLDGGLSDRGEPYLVTEYIDGQALDRFCDEQRLSIKQRLRLFLQVVAAVEHAHQNLIVHRDLKPSNILVTKDHTAKLLDFGTAKIIGEANEKTATESMLLTPRYASPEQLRNEAITTRSDVYSLGMILYELLSGSRPFTTSGDALGELARAYQFSAPTALGRTITPEAANLRSMSVRELTRELSGDLRAITAKALEHDPKNRYGSATEFARDVAAFLEARPVSAQPHNALYVARKFVERQKVAVAAAALILIAITVGIVSTIQQKRVAERRFAQVRQLARYQLFDLYDQTEKIPGSTKLRAGMAQQALQYLDGLSSESTNDESLRIELAEGYLRTGDVLGNYAKDNLGQYEKALAAYQKGRTLLQGLNSLAARRIRVNIDFTEALAGYAAGIRVSSLPKLLAAAKEYENILAQEPKNVDTYIRLGKAYASVARALQMPNTDNEFSDRSAEYTTKAKDAFSNGLEKSPNNSDLIAALHSLCATRAVWTADAKPQESLRWAGESEMWALRRKNEPRSSDFLVAEANRFTGRAAARNATGEPLLALEDMKAAVAILEELTRDKDNHTAVINLVTALTNQSLIEYDLNRKDDYRASCERAWKLIEQERLAGNFPPTLERYRYRIMSYLVWAYVEAKDPKAPDYVDMAYRELRKKMSEDPKSLSLRLYFTDILINLRPPGYDRPEEALTVAREMIQIAPKSFNGYESTAFALDRLGRHDEAADALRKGLALLDAPKPGQPPSKIYSVISKRLAEYEAKAADKPPQPAK